MKTTEAAKGKWREILLSYGVPDRIFNLKHQPCIFPQCGGTDRFRWANRDGDGGFFCNHCGSGDGLSLLQKFTGKSFKELAREIDKIVGNIQPQKQRPKTDNSRRIKFIMGRWKHASQCKPVIEYLKGRGLSVVSGLMAVESEAYYADGKAVGKFPVMVSPFYNVAGKIITLHLTYIQDGKKAPVSSPKKLLPAIQKLDGGAIRLTQPHKRLCIAEGVETALAVMKRYKAPCWASYCADMLEKFVPPKGVEEVIVCGDNDNSFVGQASAYILAKKLYNNKYQVQVRIPPKQGDFADF